MFFKITMLNLALTAFCEISRFTTVLRSFTNQFSTNTARDSRCESLIERNISEACLEGIFNNGF